MTEGSNSLVVNVCTMLALRQVSPYERPLSDCPSDLNSILDCVDYPVEKSLPVPILVLALFQHIPFECIVANLLRPSISTSLYKIKLNLDCFHIIPFTRNSMSSSYALRNSATDLKLPKKISSNGQRCFSYRGAKMWNDLPDKTKQASSLGAFKKLV